MSYRITREQSAFMSLMDEANKAREEEARLQKDQEPQTRKQGNMVIGSVKYRQQIKRSRDLVSQIEAKHPDGEVPSYDQMIIDSILRHLNLFLRKMAILDNRKRRQ